MNSVELLEKKQALKDEARALVEKAEKEIRSLNDEENTRYQSIKSEIENINAELRALDVNLPQETANQINNNSNTSTKMKKRFSLVNAVRSVMNGSPLDEISQCVVNAGREQMAKRNLDIHGQIVLPMMEDVETRALTVSTEGEDLVATEIFDIVAPLRARNVLAKAGAQIITGVRGDAVFPSSTEIECGWETEIASAADRTPTFSSVKCAPKRLACVVPISRMLLEQDSVGIENYLREQIILSINGKLEATLLGTAAGSATQPAGLLYQSGTLTAVTTYKGVTDIEAAAEAANFYGNMSWLVSPAAKSVLRNMTRGTNTAAPVFANDEIDGVKVLSTSHLKNNNAVYGDFSNLAIVLWGGGDIIVDPYTLGHQGMVRLITNVYVDAKPLVSGAFKPCNITAPAA